MFKNMSGIGLDIGSKKIKLVQVKQTKGGLQVVTYGSLATPYGAVETGNILEVEQVGETLAALVDKLNLQGKRVISAVSGPQVYTRNLIMPRMKLKELKAAVTYEATTFLPIPVAQAAIDVFPLRSFEDGEGKKVEIFFVAVRRQQVENLHKVCRIARLKLVTVEIEPLALNRVLQEDYKAETKAYLYIGAARSYFSVFCNQVLIYHRYLACGSSAFYPGGTFEEPSALKPRENSNNEKHNLFTKDIIAEVSRSTQYYTLENDDRIEEILLCGGGAKLEGLAEAIATKTNCQVKVADVLKRFILPGGANGSDKHALDHDFLVALGLASRGFI
ncbi:MAG: type IV pilus assembly protein PilM [Syntrophomonadaceae bacterium]|nr:type IV pilus assembly protein PilM [Syntrophomonadaceae bacterium]MDD3889521.1 type IV pilus assembly protein PilM [Syntrophomonadaceae bacterium]MDD4548773.1 type IV pilus assembly protein PilM [Syntrophomonadaceae bacterium]